jgi:formylglycine-generating enzyme required for sulfatase activity
MANKRKLFFFLIAGIGILFVFSSCTPSNEIPTLSVTPTPGIGSTWISPVDGMVMVYVPEGEFTMGMDADQALEVCFQFQMGCSHDWFTDAEPVHKVYLDAFWIDQTEVTNAMYALCVADGDCQSPVNSSSYSRSSYYGNPEFNDSPVVYADWNMANAYCTWAGRRLPTEAEWEKAARGTDERIYPWGNNAPNENLLNFQLNVGDTTAVGSYPAGASPYGALDMAGNVLEWVADWYSGTYYRNSPTENPLGPDLGDTRVLRGGAWSDSGGVVRSAFRTRSNPTNSGDYLGFRCARDANP